MRRYYVPFYSLITFKHLRFHVRIMDLGSEMYEVCLIKVGQAAAEIADETRDENGTWLTLGWQNNGRDKNKHSPCKSAVK